MDRRAYLTVSLKRNGYTVRLVEDIPKGVKQNLLSRDSRAL